MSVYRFIAAEKAAHSIAIMCRVLEVSRSGYHAWTRRPLGPRAVEDARLTERIRELHRSAAACTARRGSGPTSSSTTASGSAASASSG